ncbi:MAG: hypothetical protein GXO78_11250 [Calditrichaeota bacterium]|nr:hypothetical protein [Calditrichota bacterium]
MTCHQARQIMDTYFDQDRLTDISPEVWQHLHRCPECQFHFRSLQGLNAAIESLEKRPLQSDVTLLDVPSLVQEQSSSFRRSVPVWKVAAAAALFLIVLVLGIGYWSTSGHVTPVAEQTPEIFLEDVRVADQPARFLVYQPDKEDAKYTIIWMF